MSDRTTSSISQGIDLLVVALCVHVCVYVYMLAIQFTEMALDMYKMLGDEGIPAGFIRTLAMTQEVFLYGPDRSMHDMALVLVFFVLAAWRRWRGWRVWIGASVAIPLVDFLIFQLPEVLFDLPRSAAEWFLTAVPAGALAAAIWNLYALVRRRVSRTPPAKQVA